MSLPSDVGDKSAAPWRHLHPAVLLFDAGRILRRMLVPLIIGGVAVSSREGGMRSFIFVSAIISTFGFISGYLSFRYRLSADGIEIREGVFTRRHRTIAINRISHVNTHQNALARMMGVVRLEIETEDGGVSQASFSALSLSAAEQIRQHIGNVGPSRRDERIIYWASLRDRVLAGATTLQIGGVLAIGLLTWRYSRRIGVEESPEPGAPRAFLSDVITFLNELFDTISASQSLIILSIVICLLTLWVFSIVVSIVRWYGFRVIEQGDELHLESGALSRSRLTIVRDRIQAIEVRASLLRNLLGLKQIALVTAGSGRRDRARSRVFIPITSTEATGGYLNVLWPQTGDDVQWQPVHPYYRRQHITRGFLRLILLTLIALGFITLNPASMTIIAVTVALLAWLTWRTATPSFSKTGYALTNGYLHVRRGAVSPRRWVVATSRIQAVILVQGLFQRRHGVMNVVIDVNGLANNQRIEIPNIPQAQAEMLQRELTPRGRAQPSAASQHAINR